MRRLQQKGQIGCVIGRDSYAAANAVCLSCRKQDVPCPFLPPGVDAAPQKANLEPGVVAGGKAKGKGPNKTEMAYGHLLKMEHPEAELVTAGLHVRIEHRHVTDMAAPFKTAKIVYEGLTIRLENGHDYTADWAVFFPDGRLLLAEVKPQKGKDGYRHPSYQRARCMFDQCKVDYPQFQWRWAEKRGMSWNVTE